MCRILCSRVPRWIATALMLLLLLGGAHLAAPANADLPAPPLRLKAGAADTGAQVALSTLRDAEYLIVQFEGPIREDWRQALAASGVIIHDYVPDFAYVVRRGSAKPPMLQALPGVRWIGAFQPEMKALTHLAQYDVAHKMTVQLFPDANLEAVTKQAAALGCAVHEAWADRLAAYLVATVPPGAMPGLQRIPAVRWIERYAEPAIDNNVARSYDVTAVDSTWDDLGLYGAGQIVCVADTGLDNGNLSTVHPDFRGRIVAGYGWGRTGNWSDPNYHGTHVAGSVLGNGIMSDANPAIHDYKYAYAGTAPEARLIIQSGYASDDSILGGLPTNLASLFNQAYADGARIHTNSWSMRIVGTDPDDIHGVYSSAAHQVDAYVWERRDLLILASVSNDGIDADQDGVIDRDSTKAPAVAKNVVGVGASENYRPDQSQAYGSGGWADEYPTRPVSIDSMADDMHGMAAFSGRGPADDGRIKPDIVAPGTYMVSTQSQVTDNTGWGRVDDYYCYASGTSMATPFTAGAAAIVRQYYAQAEQVPRPSAALLKATLLLGGRNIAPGQYGSGPCQEIPDAFPNNVAGFGLLNLRDSIAPWAPRTWAYDDDWAGLRTDQYATYEVDVLAPSTTGLGRRLEPVQRGALAPGLARGALPDDLFADVSVPIEEVQGLTAGTELVRDGGFEQGLAYWSIRGLVETTTGHSGSQALYMGAYDDAHDFCWQTVSIPGDISDGIISFWLYQRSDEEICGLYDWFWAGLYDTADDVTTYSDLVFRDGMGVTNQWIKVTHRLTTEEIEDIRGKQIDLTFEIRTDDYGATSVRIDEVSFRIARRGARLAPGELRAVLTWSDYPGAVFAETALVNDLDLIVVDPQGYEHFGNGGAELDGLNTVEAVYITNPTPGRYRIHVQAYNVPQGKQPYALTMSWEEQPVVRNNHRFMPVIRR